MMMRGDRGGQLWFSAAASAIIGNREQQQDYVICYPSEPGDYINCFVVLSDGMGGHEDGALASRTICTAYAASFIAGGFGDLKDALHDANEALAREKQQGHIGKTAGGTLVALHVQDHAFRWLSVGDSILFLFRDGTLRQLNHPHTWGTLRHRESGGLPNDALMPDNALYSAVSGEVIEAVDVNGPACRLQTGDRFILASDGVLPIYGEMETILARPEVQHASPHQVADLILQHLESRKIESQDNATISVVDVKACHTNIKNKMSGIHKSIFISELGDRKNQQDSVLSLQSPYARLAVVADGAGGHENGAEASQCACRVMAAVWDQYLKDGLELHEAAKVIHEAFLYAHREILGTTVSEARVCGKTTIVAVYEMGHNVVIGHLGDSRAYVLNRLGWELCTKDDSVVQCLFDAGRISLKEMKNHPDQSLLTQALGTPGEIRPHVKMLRIQENEEILLCCDGFWNQLPEREWARKTWYDDTPQEILRTKVDAAVRAAHSHSDNVSVIWLYCPANHEVILGKSWLTVILTGLYLILLALVVFLWYVEFLVKS